MSRLSLDLLIHPNLCHKFSVPAQFSQRVPQNTRVCNRSCLVDRTKPPLLNFLPFCVICGRHLSSSLTSSHSAQPNFPPLPLSLVLRGLDLWRRGDSEGMMGGDGPFEASRRKSRALALCVKHLETTWLGTLSLSLYIVLSISASPACRHLGWAALMMVQKNLPLHSGH